MSARDCEPWFSADEIAEATRLLGECVAHREANKLRQPSERTGLVLSGRAVEPLLVAILREAENSHSEPR